MSEDFKVVEGNAEAAISIMREVAQWGHSVGFNVWKDEALAKEKLLEHAREEEFCIGQVLGEDACCMILQWEDKLFWPKAKRNEAGYVHKLCVRRKYAGQRLSAKMVEFAIEECRKRNIDYLRLDTRWVNARLCNLYKSLGFEIVDKFLLDEGEAFALFEMKLTSLK